MQDLSGIMADKITVWINKNNASTEKEQIIVRYGLELIIENITKFLLLICVAILMDKVFESILVIGIFSTLRLNAGGVHMKSGLGCSLAMLFLWYVGMIGSAMIIITDSIIVISLVCFIVALYLYAPCDTKNNPITDMNIRNRKKYGSIITVVILSCIMLVIQDDKIRTLMYIAIVFEIITILPIVNYINQKRLKEDV